MIKTLTYPEMRASNVLKNVFPTETNAIFIPKKHNYNANNKRKKRKGK